MSVISILWSRAAPHLVSSKQVLLIRSLTRHIEGLATYVSHFLSFFNIPDLSLQTTKQIADVMVRCTQTSKDTTKWCTCAAYSLTQLRGCAGKQTNSWQRSAFSYLPFRATIISTLIQSSALFSRSSKVRINGASMFILSADHLQKVSGCWGCTYAIHWSPTFNSTSIRV